MSDFKDLKVWQRAHQLVLDTYRATATFPAGERFGLTSQLRRSAVSIGANIAERGGRATHRDRLRFLHMAQGSAREVESHLLVARDLGLLAADTAATLLQQIAEIQRMLSALIPRT